MEQGSIEQFVAMLGSKVQNKLRGKKGDEIVINCPLARWRHEKGLDRSPSFSIRISTSQSPCYCYGCGFEGSLWYLVKTMEDLSGKSFENEMNFVLKNEGFSNKTYVTNKISYDLNINKNDGNFEDFLFDESEIDVYRKMPMNYEYLSERKIKNESIDIWGIFYDIYNKRIVFPTRNAEGKLKGFTGRLATEKCIMCNGTNFNDLLCIDCGTWKTPKWRHSKGLLRNSFLFGEDKIVSENPMGYLVEGPIDVVRLYQNGLKNVVCALGTVLSEFHIERLCQFFSTIIVIGDGDKAGRHMLSDVYDNIGKRIVVKYINLPNGKDPGDLSDDEIKSLICDSEKLIFMGVSGNG